MATAIGQIVVYKTNSGFVPAIITAAYTLSGGVYSAANSVAYNDSSVDAADISFIGVYQSTHLTKVAKVTAVGSEGAVAAASVNTVTVGTWAVLT